MWSVFMFSKSPNLTRLSGSYPFSYACPRLEEFLCISGPDSRIPPAYSGELLFTNAYHHFPGFQAAPQLIDVTVATLKDIFPVTGRLVLDVMRSLDTVAAWNRNKLQNGQYITGTP